MERELKVPVPNGTASVSPSTTSTSSGASPSTSAATWARLVAWPCPVLIVPEKTVALPSAWTTTRALSWPARRKPTEPIPIEGPTPELSEKVATPIPRKRPSARKAA